MEIALFIIFWKIFKIFYGQISRNICSKKVPKKVSMNDKDIASSFFEIVEGKSFEYKTVTRRQVVEKSDSVFAAMTAVTLATAVETQAVAQSSSGSPSLILLQFVSVNFHIEAGEFNGNLIRQLISSSQF